MPLFQHLLENNKIDPNFELPAERRFIVAAVDHQAREIVNCLLNHGANPNVVGRWKGRKTPQFAALEQPELASPLYIANVFGDLAMLKLLLKYANPNEKFDGVLLPLFQLCRIYETYFKDPKEPRYEYPQMFQALLENRALPELEDPMGLKVRHRDKEFVVFSPLEYAEHIEDDGLMKLLLSRAQEQ